jgi:hypothetical protein
MRVSKLLADQFIPGARSLDLAQFEALLTTARSESRDPIRRLSGWIFVGALVLPFFLFIVLPALWFSAHGISLMWLVILIPVNILISTSAQEIAMFWLLYPALRRSPLLHTSSIS